MSSFKDMVERDLFGTFLNPDEFGEKRTIQYDGETYKDVPVVLEGYEERNREPYIDDHTEGLYRVTDLMFCAASSLSVLPEVGTKLYISTREGGTFFRAYYVVTSTNKNGMLQIRLGVIDE